MGNPIDFPPRTPNSARPIGVTLSAVVCLLGSAVTVVIGVGVLVASFGLPPSVPASMVAPPADSARVMLTSAVMLTVLAALGIATGIGLLKLRPWARTSILVFGGVMAAICLSAGLMIFALSLPVQQTMPDGLTMAKLRPIMLGMYTVPFLIGVWWLVQFNRPGTKAAFAGGGEVARTGDGHLMRPLSITIIGALFVTSGAFTIVPAYSRMPAMMFGLVLTGWAATMLYVVVAAVQISAGSGLLKLHETARILTIAWIVIGIANLAVMAWVPGLRANVETYERTIGRMPAGPPPFDMVQLMRVMMPLWLLVAVVTIWFLVRRRAAFHPHTER